MSPIPITPQSSEKSTSGTTSILSAFTNILPIMAKRPPTICVLMNAESIMLKTTPTIRPSTIPAITFAVRDIPRPVPPLASLAILASTVGSHLRA